MLCERPFYGYVLHGDRGKKKLQVFAHESVPIEIAYSDEFKRHCFKLPCRKCLPCRLKHASEWSTRCVLEAKEHKDNMFITLTYNDEHKPAEGVSTKALSRFMKTLRKHFERKGITGIRFFGCGEYGGRYQRPHYHLLLFGCPRFKDEVQWKYNKGQGYWITISEELNKLWGKGFCTIGQVNEASAGYVARYTMKKLDGVTRLPNDMNPEFILMSRRPGIGMKYYEKHKEHLYKYDEVLIGEGKFVPLPKAFDRKYKEDYDKALDDCLRVNQIFDTVFETNNNYPEVIGKRRLKGEAFMNQCKKDTGLSEHEIEQQKIYRLKQRVKRLERQFEEWHY